MNEKFIAARVWKSLARLAALPGLVAVSLLFLGSGITADAEQSIALAWDPSPSEQVTGYNVYYGGVSREYTNLISVAGTNSAAISGLTEGATYYFAVTATDGFGGESDFSDELSYVVPYSTPPQLRLTFSGDIGPRITATGQPGHIFEIEATTDFSIWTVINIQAVGLGGTVDYVDADAVNYPSRFYRIHDTQP